MEVGVVPLVGAEVPVGGRGLLHQRAVAAPDALQERGRLDPALVDRVVEVVHARHHVRPHRADDPLGVGRLTRVQQHHVGEGGGVECLPQGPTRPRRPRAAAGQGLRRRDAARRDREHHPVAVLAGQLHGPRSEGGDVEGNGRLEAHVLLLADQHLDRARGAGRAVVHRLPAQQAAQHLQVLRVLRDAHRGLAHAAGGGVAGAHSEVHAAGREAVERGHRGHVHRRDARAADRDAGSQPEAARLLGGQGQHRVAVGEQHLAVGHPHRVVAQGLGVAEEADLVDVGHHADGEAHVCSSGVAGSGHGGHVRFRMDSSIRRARGTSLSVQRGRSVGAFSLRTERSSRRASA